MQEEKQPTPPIEEQIPTPPEETPPEEALSNKNPPDVSEEDIDEDDDKPILRELEITLPASGEKILLKKLKAGLYYEAQKIFVKWFGDLQKLLTKDKIDFEALKDPKTGKIVDIEKATEKLQNATSFDIVGFLDQSESNSKLMLQLVAICIGSTPKELTEKYYPEDITELAVGAIKLNNFIGNLKKSAAPTAGLGA